MLRIKKIGLLTAFLIVSVMAGACSKAASPDTAETTMAEKVSSASETAASRAKDGGTDTTKAADAEKETTGDQEAETAAGTGGSEGAPEREIIPAPGFTLMDQEGNTHSLADYKGKTVFLNFWATWCPPCRMEMPDIQKLYEKHGSNSGDLIVLGVAGPNLASETDIAGITAFLKENNYSFPVVMDETGSLFEEYGISSFPTTFMIDDEGNVHGYVSGALSAEFMDSIVQQTMDKVYY